MPDRIERLRTTLAELEAELRELPAVDTETRAVLEEAVAEITTVLQRTASASPKSQMLDEDLDDDTPVESRWREAVADFEVSHPQIAGLLQRVINTLAQIGI